mgnify:FL=1
MKVGDLVKYKPNDWGWEQVGIITRCIAGTDKRKVVKWVDGHVGSYREEDLRLVNESR